MGLTMTCHSSVPTSILTLFNEMIATTTGLKMDNYYGFQLKNFPSIFGNYLPIWWMPKTTTGTNESAEMKIINLYTSISFLIFKPKSSQQFIFHSTVISYRSQWITAPASILDDLPSLPIRGGHFKLWGTPTDKNFNSYFWHQIGSCLYLICLD